MAAIVKTLITITLLLLAAGAKAEPVYMASRCSAVALKGGLVLTAAHCVDGPYATFMRDRKAKEGYTATLLLANNYIDFALYKLDDQYAFNGSVLSCEPLKLRQHFMVKGWPGDVGYTETIGYVAGYKTELPPLWTKVHIAIMSIFYGSSGSGAYGLNDEVIGIVVGMVPGTSIGVLVPADEICGAIIKP